MDKDRVLALVKEWIKNDQEMRILRKEEKRRRQENAQLSENILSVMKEHDITCFETKGGTLVHKTRRSKRPLTQKELLSAALVFFDGDVERAQALSSLLLESRRVVVSESIELK